MKAEIEEVTGRSYWLFLCFIIAGGVIKYVMGERDLSIFYLELASLCTFLCCMIFYSLKSGSFSIKQEDECQRFERLRWYSKAYMGCFWVYGIGNLYYLPSGNTLVMWINGLVLYIPVVYLLVVMIRRGLFVFSNKAESADVNPYRDLKKRSVAFGVFLGIFISAPWKRQNSIEHDILNAIIVGLISGFLWYWGMKGMMIISKRKTKGLEQEEGKDAKPVGRDCRKED